MVGSLAVVAEPDTQDHPGQRLGLPAQGPGSVASWPVRILALVVDWIPSLLVANVIAGFWGLTRDESAFLPLAVFFVEVTLFTALTGSSFGQLATRLAVVRLDGRRVSLGRAALRTLLICLVIPPVVFNSDNRGVHDLATGTVLLRR